MHDPSCIFCKIVKKEIPSLAVYEDADVLAFLDIRPLARGHTLVIPKAHAKQMEDMTPESAAAFGRALALVAGKAQRGVGAPASTVAVNNGPAAGQEVPHVHAHVVPRTDGDGFGPIHALFTSRPALSKEELAEVADRIRKG